MARKKKADKLAEEIAEHIIHGMGNNQFKYKVSKKGKHLLKDDDLGLLLLITERKTASEFEKIIYDLEKFQRKKIGRTNYSVILYKDGKMYFRSGHNFDNQLQSLRYKQKEYLSLKNYTPKEIRRIITLTPAEKYFTNDEYYGSDGGSILYYQPKSERLKKTLVTFDFEPVTLDYSHKNDWYLENEKQSKLYFIWNSFTMHKGIIDKRLFDFKTDNDFFKNYSKE